MIKELKYFQLFLVHGGADNSSWKKVQSNPIQCLFSSVVKPKFIYVINQSQSLTLKKPTDGDLIIHEKIKFNNCFIIDLTEMIWRNLFRLC